MDMPPRREAAFDERNGMRSADQERGDHVEALGAPTPPQQLVAEPPPEVRSGELGLAALPYATSPTARPYGRYCRTAANNMVGDRRSRKRRLSLRGRLVTLTGLLNDGELPLTEPSVRRRAPAPGRPGEKIFRRGFGIDPWRRSLRRRHYRHAPSATLIGEIHDFAE